MTSEQRHPPNQNLRQSTRSATTAVAGQAHVCPTRPSPTRPAGASHEPEYLIKLSTVHLCMTTGYTMSKFTQTSLAQSSQPRRVAHSRARSWPPDERARARQPRAVTPASAAGARSARGARAAARARRPARRRTGAAAIARAPPRPASRSGTGPPGARARAQHRGWAAVHGLLTEARGTDRAAVQQHGALPGATPPAPRPARYRHKPMEAARHFRVAHLALCSRMHNKAHELSHHEGRNCRARQALSASGCACGRARRRELGTRCLAPAPGRSCHPLRRRAWPPLPAPSMPPSV